MITLSLLQVLCNCLKALSITTIVNQQNYIRTFEISDNKSSESFLISCIPKLYFYISVIRLNSFLSEIDSNRWDITTYGIIYYYRN